MLMSDDLYALPLSSTRAFQEDADRSVPLLFEQPARDSGIDDAAQADDNAGGMRTFVEWPGRASQGQI